MLKKYRFIFIIFSILLILLNYLNLSILFNPNIINGAVKKDNVNDEIPIQYVPLYQKAAQKYGVSWFFLASIHNQETSFSKNVSVSSAGAIGHTQFMRCTWVGWKYSGCKGTKGNAKNVTDSALMDPNIISKNGGYGIDANLDGKANPWDIVDSIYSMANYLASSLRNVKKTSGYDRVYEASKIYNHSDSYAKEVANRYSRYTKEWKGESPDNSLLLTGVVKDDMWLKGSYSDETGVIQGTPIGNATSSTGKVVNNGEEILYISPFETRVINPDNFHNVGIKDKGKKTSVFTEYLLTDVAKFLASFIYILTIFFGVLLFGYMSIIWLMILLTRRGFYYLENVIEKISLGKLNPYGGLGKLIISTIISFFLLGISISGYISDLFILIYSSIIILIDNM